VSRWDAMSASDEMNTMQTNWTMTNVVDFFSSHSDPVIASNYSFLQGKKKNAPKELTYSSLAKIYGKPYGGEAFKKGKWRITDEARGDAFVEYLGDLVEFLPYARSARFIYAYTDVAFHEEYDHERMLKKLAQNHQNHTIPILTTSNPTQYGRMLTKIYNFNQSKNLTMFRSAWI